MYTIKFDKPAFKQLKKLDRNFQKRILTKISQLKTNPSIGKPLLRELRGHYSLRVWPYRIIYRIENNELIITVVAIGHRKEVYDDILRKIVG